MGNSDTLNNSTKKNSKDDLKGFYRLIPKSSACISHNKSSIPLQENEAAEIEELRKELCDKLKYESIRTNDIEGKITTVKTLFIIQNGKTIGELADSEALIMLVADQDTIFKDGDGTFRDRQLNGSAHSNRRKAHRNNNKEETNQRRLEDCLQEFKHRTKNPVILDLGAKLMNAIISKYNTYDKLYKWVFSRIHVKLTKENEEEYHIKCRTWEDCLEEEVTSDEATYLKELLSHEEILSKLISRCITEQNPNNITLIDLDALRLSCRVLLTDEDKNLLDSLSFDGFEFFANFLLRVYMLKARADNDCNAPPISKYDEGDAQSLYAFKRRNEKLKDLFLKYSRSNQKTDFSIKIDLWNRRNLLKSSQKSDLEEKIKPITEAIYEFFQSLDRPLEESTNARLNVQARVRWILEEYQSCRSDLPCAILCMVLSYGKWISTDRDVDYDSEKFDEDRFLKDIVRSLQRYEEIVLLQKLHDILLSSEMKTCIGSWNLYVSIRGERIRSYEEYVLWSRLTKELHREIPRIGVQLLYLNYCTQCLPPHYEYLCYQSGSKLHRGGFCNFWKNTKNESNGLQFKMMNVTPMPTKKYGEIFLCTTHSAGRSF